MPRFKPLFILAVPIVASSGIQARADEIPPSFARTGVPASAITGGVALPPARVLRPRFRPIAVTPAEAPKPPVSLLVATPPVTAPKAVPTVTPNVTVIPKIIAAPATNKPAAISTPTVLTQIEHPKATTPGFTVAPPLLAALPGRSGANVNATAILPRTEAASVSAPLAAPKAPPSAITAPPLTPLRTPSRLSSREAAANQLLLARMDAKLAGAERRLNRAEARLTEGQRQLGAFNDVLRSAMLEAGPDARGLHPFVRVAQRYLGTPYVWGGESARGFDCSGFIMRVMRDLGYRALPHSAAEQFRYGLPIAKGALKPGDIVFFANTYKPGVSHVGIYLGHNRFIHAANSQVGTIVSSLSDSKWVAHYAGARRLVPARS
jgi:cell wall-associated NlpC family hydrolase